LRILNPADSPNTDGINPESCEQVTICAADISVGDDCIAIKSGKRGTGTNTHLARTQDISITHCLMQRGHGAVVLGSEMSGDIRQITVSRCEFIGTDRGLRLKTRRGRGGTIADVTLSDVNMTDVATPLVANAFYFCDPDGKDTWVQSRSPAPVDATTPMIGQVNVTRVTARRVSLAAAALLGLPERVIGPIRLNDFQVSYDPSAKSDLPLMASGQIPVRHAGLLAEHARVEGHLIILPDDKDAATC
jgi:polygalacturonase